MNSQYNSFFHFKVPRLKNKYLSDVWAILNYLPNTAGVYLLTETNLNVRYVGSSINVRSRAISYMYPSSQSFEKCLFNELDTRFIKIELLQDCDGMNMEDLRKAEAYWINKLNTFYPNGLNKGTASKGTGKICMVSYNKRRQEVIAKGACYQILNFSKRLDFYLEALEKTPDNPAWSYIILKNKRTPIFELSNKG